MNDHQVSRRDVLLTGTAALALGSLPPALAAAADTDASAARVAPVTDDYYGTKVVDNYRWMENPKDLGWLPYLQAQNARTRAALDAIPGRAALARRISTLSGEATITRRVALSDSGLFYEQRAAGEQGFKLILRSQDGTARTLIDPTTIRSGQAHVSLDQWWTPSIDGRHIAYGLSPAGSEASVLHVMEVASGNVRPERIEKTDEGFISWLPDHSGFFYLQFVGERGTPEFYRDSVFKLHMLGADPATDRVVLKRGMHADVPMERGSVPLRGNLRRL